MLETTAEKYGDKRVCSDERGSVSYNELLCTAKAIGCKLSENNIRNKAVAVFMNKSNEMLISFIGTVYSGNFYVPIDVEMPDDRIKAIMDVVKPYALITDEINLEKAQKLHSKSDIYFYQNIIHTDIREEKLSKIRKDAIDTDPVYALFTSGSTGVPKGVICCHRSVINYAEWLVDTFGFNTDTIFGNQTPFYFSMSVLDIYATIRSGAELCIIPTKLFGYPVRLLEYLNEKKINTVYWVPTALCIVSRLKALEKVNMPYLKQIMFAGESMPVKQLNVWRKHLPNAMYVNLFGPTEITDIGIYYIVNREFKNDESLPIGNACDNVSFLILNKDGQEVKNGQIGELCIRGSFLALGYYNNKEKTEEAFVQNPMNSHYPEIIYKTGDLVSINSLGELIYHGRKDFQIKHRGNRIELGEIENAAGNIENMDACAAGYDAEKERIVLFYQGETVTEQMIRETMQKKVPAYMLPNVMIRMRDIPKNQNGKLDRKKLMQDYLDRKYMENNQ